MHIKICKSEQQHNQWNEKKHEIEYFEENTQEIKQDEEEIEEISKWCKAL